MLLNEKILMGVTLKPITFFAISAAFLAALFMLYCSYVGLWYLPIAALFFLAYGAVLVISLPLIICKVRRMFTQINLLHAMWILLLVGSLTFRIRTGYQLMQNPIDEAI